MLHAFLFFIAAILTGVATAFGSQALKALIGFVQHLLFEGTFSFYYHLFDLTAPVHPLVLIAAIPVVGGVLATYLIMRFAPEAKGHGVPEVIDAIVHHKGIIRPHVSVIKAIASALCVGSGGSAGIEGPIVQIGACFGSMQHYWLKKITVAERCVLLACGGAAAFAAGFCAPLAGIAFAIEVMLPKRNWRAILAVILASAAAWLVTIGIEGIHSFLRMDPFIIEEQHPYIDYVMIGVGTGFFSALFVYALRKGDAWHEHLKRKLGRAGPYILHGTGMLMVGLLLLTMGYLTGQLYINGPGYPVILRLLHPMHFDMQMVLLLIIMKFLITLFTLCSGGSGGIFSPLLLMGGAFGALYSLLLQYVAPELGYHYIGFVMAGMAGMIGGASAALFTAIIILLEMTQAYGMLLPFIVTVCTASWTRRMLINKTIYSPQK
jgi:CIC family chloride channel protein